jgi:transposase-like protein
LQLRQPTIATRKWHLDEVALRICGHRHWLWRAADQHVDVLDILVQSSPNRGHDRAGAGTDEFWP